MSQPISAGKQNIPSILLSTKGTANKKIPGSQSQVTNHTAKFNSIINNLFTQSQVKKIDGRLTSK